jgi:hypothetical protein
MIPCTFGFFPTLIAAEGFQYDNVFDWTEKRFQAICNREATETGHEGRSKRDL